MTITKKLMYSFSTLSMLLIFGLINEINDYSGPQSQDKKYYEFKMVSFSTAEQRCPFSSFKSAVFGLP